MIDNITIKCKGKSEIKILAWNFYLNELSYLVLQVIFDFMDYIEILKELGVELKDSKEGTIFKVVK